MYVEYGMKMREEYSKLHKLMENDEFVYEIQKKYDRGYKYLFSVKKYFLEFLRYFVREKWTYDITEDNIEQINNEYILSNFASRESDVVYKIKTKGKSFYFVLLEIQSVIDEKMSFRILEYMVEIWRRNLKNNKNSKLPIIIPCVLYVGKEKWNKSREFKSLFSDWKLFEKILPNFEYILIDINNYDDEILLNFTGIMGNVLYIEKSKNRNEIKKRLIMLLNNVKKMNVEEQKSFSEWIAHLIAKNENDIEEIKTNIINKEEKTMLGEIIEQLTQEWIDEGIVKGREEGRREGKEEGRRITLKKLLSNKLGIMPDEIISKIDNMADEEIDLLEQKIFTVKDWEEI